MDKKSYLTSLTTIAVQITFLSFVVALALGINYLSAWVGPTALPPVNNIAAPVNIGTTNQVKDANLSVGHSANTATDYGLISYGKIRSTVGGYEFPDGTTQATAAAGGGSLSAIRSYTSGATWTKPAGLAYAVVEVWGGGAGGQSYTTTGGTVGGASSFGAYISAAGGGAPSGSEPRGGRGGTGSGGDVNLSGGDGNDVAAVDGNIGAAGGQGGAAPKGGPGGAGGYANVLAGQAGKVPGGGGGGAGSQHASGAPAGGGGGGYSLKRIAASSLGAAETVTVGAGGAGGAGGAFAGGAGAGGMVVVYEYQ